MIAYRVPDSYDVITVPDSWDCFLCAGWLYRRHVNAKGRGIDLFYREKWIGVAKVETQKKERQ